MPKTVLVIGSGAREHAIANGLQQPDCSVIVSPGNAGIADQFKCIQPTEPKLRGFMGVARDLRPSLVVIGPEAPLVAGLSDTLTGEGFVVFGPDQRGAMVTEGSKVACRMMLHQAGVPSPRFSIANDLSQALSFIGTLQGSIVVKADGLAAGKGVVVCQNRAEAESAVHKLMDPAFADGAGSKVVFEELIVGDECSFMVVTDGFNAVPLLQARDYKRAQNGDQGDMTGGMGAWAPVHRGTQFEQRVMREVVQPTIDHLREKRNIVYRGILYFGLMVCDGGRIVVLEINARLGDPETQVVLPLLQTNLYDLMIAATQENGLAGTTLSWKRDYAVGVVLAAAGYPGSPKTGDIITGISVARTRGASVYCAGVGQREHFLVTAGGRVVTVVGIGRTAEAARAKAYDCARLVHFDGMHNRTDIAS